LLALAKEVFSTNIKLCIKIPSLQYPRPSARAASVS
jgi:hypothetical protein